MKWAVVMVLILTAVWIPWVRTTAVAETAAVCVMWGLFCVGEKKAGIAGREH